MQKFSSSCLFILLLTACSINPVTHKHQLMLISEHDEIEMGRDSEPQVVREFDGSWEDHSVTSYVASVGHRIARVCQRNHLTFKFGVLNTDIPNAFALPGGIIYITRGLLVRLDNEAQLAGVLGHEVGHVAAKHSAAQISKAYLGMILVAGAATYAQSKNQDPNIIAAAGQISLGLIMKGYSRTDELEADREGANYIYALGYNPEAMIQVFEVLKNAEKEFGGGGTPTIFSSHPRTTQRIKEMREELPKKYPDHSKGIFAKEAFDKNISHFKNNYAMTAGEYDKARAKFVKKEYDQALRHINTAIGLMSNNSMFYLLRGMIYESVQNYSSAIQDYASAVRCNNNNYDAHLGHGRALFKRDNYAGAEPHFKRATALVYQIPDAHLWLSRTLEKLGRMREAQEEFQIYKKLKSE